MQSNSPMFALSKSTFFYPVASLNLASDLLMTGSIASDIMQDLLQAPDNRNNQQDMHAFAACMQTPKSTVLNDDSTSLPFHDGD